MASAINVNSIYAAVLRRAMLAFEKNVLKSWIKIRII